MHFLFTTAIFLILPPFKNTTATATPIYIFEESENLTSLIFCIIFSSVLTIESVTSTWQCIYKNRHAFI